MHNRFIIEKSYGLEHVLSESLENMRDNAAKNHDLKKQIIKLRRQRQQIIQLPATFEEDEGESEDE